MPSIHLKLDLDRIFSEINVKHFSGGLQIPKLIWNPRLRSSSGRFIAPPPRIELAAYLAEEPDAELHVYDTMAHEMVHYWLWSRKRPHGHTPEFMQKLRELGASRYNPIPKRRPFRYLYECPCCLKQYPARKKWGALACLACCKLHSRGRYDVRFRLVFRGECQSSRAFQEKTPDSS